MVIGKVVGRLWSTRKDEKLNGQKFLVVRLLKDKEKELEGFFVAADNVGAGNGDLVLITKGASARTSLGDKAIPVDAAVVGIIDSIEVDDE
ncbi:EutN/CcmL family microcompartment protein [Clostridium frigidicarnis]|uniref:Ethanolamine utilization protein EutN n=1 Tax=Clostridium frigidicarnis TaxID=84698 RepID=A0A1I0ZSI8_9CLOT|nr:EutN/CcmL family microcompartment protein [Clostridium frigidicarnis]SFB28507.1 ethanolamine utilization protein EutN [Clostridium frigidicarnis]